MPLRIRNESRWNTMNSSLPILLRKIMAGSADTPGNSIAGSHYTVLARRFRPQAFDDVIGQEHVARALRNAIRAGRVAHAYLFTGARGVGKTSTARILAKALNCPHVQDGVPCNQCEICEGITTGNDVDVLEIDGASNRGIDDIRSLRANVGVRSMRTQFKVYIIDEVHMLTREAFNALLKTLEEPPPNVKFVFCTTEPNKVPDTILSRCQRFDFSAIGETSIAQRLREIAKAEGFEVDDEALELVARRARGSMRDSQSLFDQLLAFSEGVVTAEDVHRMLGTAGDERLVELFSAIIEHRPGEVLTLLEDSLTSGVQAGELMDQAIGYVRDLMVIQAGGNSVALSAISNRFREPLSQQAQRLGMHSIMAAFQVLADAKNQMFRSTFSRTILEMSLIQLSLLENLSAISDLLSGKLPALPDLSAAAAAMQQLGHQTAGSGGTNQNPAGGNLAAGDTDGNQKKNAEIVATQTAQDRHADQAASDSHATTASTGNQKAIAENRSTGAAAASTGNTEGLDAAEEDRQPEPELLLTKENLPELLQLVCNRLGIVVAGGLRQASVLALRGEDIVEVHLAKTYAAAQASLETEANRRRIETTIEELTGRKVQLQVVVLDDTHSAEESNAATQSPLQRPTPSANRLPADYAAKPTGPDADAGNGVRPAVDQPQADQPRVQQPSGDAASAKNGGRPASTSGATGNSASRGTTPSTKSNGSASRATPVNMLDDIDPSKDNFVQHVIDTFGATVVRIMPAPSSVPGQPDD